MKIRILHLIKSLGRGGAETLLPETLRYHNKECFEFHYIYFLPWKNQMVDEIKKEGGQVENISAGNNLMIIYQIGALKKYITNHNIDLIHCHLPWAGLAGRLLFKALRVPVLYTEHNKQERYHFITKTLNRFTFNNQTMAIAVSRDVAASIKKNIAPRIPVRLIQNAVDTTKYTAEKKNKSDLYHQLGIGNCKYVIGTVAVFRFQKRLNEWLEVFKVISDSVPGVKGLIVGDGPLRSEIEAKVIDLNLQDHIILCGLQENVKPWLSVMDVFMMTSLFEGLPIALLEAMSMGCIPACTAAGGIKEVVVQNESGLLVPIESWGDLATSVISLLNDHSIKDRLSTRARLQIVQNFSMSRMVNELENVYKAVLANEV